MIHSGGDSRRLPAYSLAGKLFSALPVKTPWGDVSTVFDEALAQSTGWVDQFSCGLVVSSGDVVLTFDGQQLEWDRPGVCGAAMRQPANIGSQHGVYVLGDDGRVYSFLQKPSAADVRAAGGMLPGGNVALDIGLIKFDPRIAANLTQIAGMGDSEETLPVLDLYEHMTWALTGEWTPKPEDPPMTHAVADLLGGAAFRCSLVEGDFTHVGTTAHFRQLMTEESRFTELYEVQQRLGAVQPAGVRSSGTIIDSVLAPGSVIDSGTIVIECDLDTAAHSGKDSILHGLMDLENVEVPDNTVVQQVPVALEDGRRGVGFRVCGVRDDPKEAVDQGRRTWQGRPLADVLDEFGINPDEVW
ncbi:MAG: hypothetical protein GY953_32095, partial [bacterium]|nr:hypothetical protein [bacterium]